MPFKGPYPTVFGGNTPAMVISATTFDGGVTNVGTIGSGGISVIDSTFLSGGILDTGVITGGINIDSRSRIVGSGMARRSSAIRRGVTGIGVLLGGTHPPHGVPMPRIRSEYIQQLRAPRRWARLW